PCRTTAPAPYGCTGVASYSITITCPTITLSPPAGALSGGTESVAYSQTFSASGGTGPYTYAVTSGSLPPGLNLTGDTVSGTPTTAGSYNFDLTATDAYNCTGVASYSIDIAPGAV